MNTLHAKIKVWLAKDDRGFFGPGTLKLLKLTHDLQSLKAACIQMGMSYSKGWKIVANVERELGYPVLNRQQGGRFGGGCDLTPEGKAIAERYEAFTKRVTEIVTETYSEFFP
ncbi:MAG: LysR family transcriptional regulator [Oscillospiraceae bacterium]|jgi:molybdate transport system regulatory protein|nr:LysR family transcriptional regulator [Oscillospiraceae bacterium]